MSCFRCWAARTAPSIWNRSSRGGHVACVVENDRDTSASINCSNSHVRTRAGVCGELTKALAERIPSRDNRRNDHGDWRKVYNRRRASAIREFGLTVHQLRMSHARLGTGSKVQQPEATQTEEPRPETKYSQV